MKFLLKAEHFDLLFRVRDREYVEDPAVYFLDFMRDKYRIDIVAEAIVGFGSEYWAECEEKDWAFFLLKWANNV